MTKDENIQFEINTDWSSSKTTTSCVTVVQNMSKGGSKITEVNIVIVFRQVS